MKNKAYPIISVVIGTLNRQELLGDCLNSLLNQSQNLEDFEVVVIDNGSEDGTLETIKSYEKKFPFFQYHVEKQKGGSYTRNRGIKEAKGELIVFLDDDAKASSNLIKRVYFIYKKENFDIWGGVYLPWYKYGKPKWYKDSYGSNKLKYNSVTKLTKNTLSLGIMVVRKSKLEQVGLFNTNLGMFGKTVGYGEEDDLQRKLKNIGCDLYYDPKLIIYHVVAKYKHNVNWFFKLSYATPKERLLSGTVKTTYFNALLIFIAAFLVMGLNIVLYTPKLFSRKYYLETWIIDVFRVVSKRICMVYLILLYKKGHDISY